MDHALYTIEKVYLLSGNVQAQHGHFQSIGASVKMLQNKVVASLEGIETVRNQELDATDLDEERLSNAEICRWAKRTWQSNPEIWRAIKETGVFGQVIVKNLENEEFFFFNDVEDNQSSVQGSVESKMGRDGYEKIC